MSMSNSKKRKTHSHRFPFTLHPTGQHCKKIKGRLHYFGTDKQKALQRYLKLNPTVFYRWRTELFEHGAAFERAGNGATDRMGRRLQTGALKKTLGLG